MKKNKVLAHLIALPKNEFKQFGKFVRNPIHNKKETVARLYEFVKKNHPVFDDKKFTKTNCFLHVFPELKADLKPLNGKADEFISSKMKNPLYILKKLLDEFILQQALKEQSREKTILFIKALFKRQMHERAFQLIDKELKQLDEMVNEDCNNHLYRFQLLEMKQDYTLDKVKIDGSIYSKLICNLDSFYLDAKLRFEYIARERCAYRGDLYEQSLSRDIRCLIENFDINRMSPDIILYSKLFQLSNEFSLKEFGEVKSFYSQHINEFSPSNKKDFGIHLFNYCIDGYKNGIKSYLKEAFDLRKFTLEKGIIFEKGQLKTIDFTNLVVMSCTLKQHDWAVQFIAENAKYLPEERRQSIVQISKAQIECDHPTPDFRKVIDLLRDVEYFNTYDNLQARSLMLRAYYHLKEWHTLTYFLDAFIKFIDRNQSIGNDDKFGCKNMIKFTKVLMNAQHKKTTKDELLSNLEALKPVRAKQWLTNRINELFAE